MDSGRCGISSTRPTRVTPDWRWQDSAGPSQPQKRTRIANAGEHAGHQVWHAMGSIISGVLTCAGAADDGGQGGLWDSGVALNAMAMLTSQIKHRSGRDNGGFRS